MVVKKVSKSQKRGDRAQAAVKANLEAAKGPKLVKHARKAGKTPQVDDQGMPRNFEPDKYRTGDRVWYKAETWYVEVDRGGNFVSIRDWPRTGAEDVGEVPKAVVQSVPRAALRKNDVLPAGNGPDLSEAEEAHRGRKRQPKVLFTDKELTAKPEKKKREPREVKPHDPNAIPLKKICGDCNVDPKLARRLLRAETSIPRPEGRWEFNPKDVERIKKVITQPIK
jgi:hypothetical protein